MDHKGGMLLKFLQAVFIQARRENQLPELLRSVAMKLLYKYDHEEGKKYPKNYRPISLLPCDYKILARILQQSLGPHMKHLPYDGQFCTSGKEIGELILFLSGTIDYCEINKKEAALVFLDFAKAFDSVSREFIYAIM